MEQIEEQISNTLLDRLMFILMKNDILNLQEIKSSFVMAMNDFTISPKETAIVVYTEGKNEYFIKKFILSKAVAGCSKNTLRNYSNEVRRALTAMGKDADAITSEAIRGKVYFDYFTENADKVRAMIGDGEWGHGVPIPTVRQAVRHSRYRIDTMEQLERLAGLALLRLRQLRKDDYFWQKEVCQHWSDVAGCTKGCSDCDICPEFVRIKPQYCCRCGATFLERTDQKFCPSCRSARRKQAQRKWARLHNQ